MLTLTAFLPLPAALGAMSKSDAKYEENEGKCKER